MPGAPSLLVELGIIGVLIAGIAMFTSVRTARGGNLVAALALSAAVAAVLARGWPQAWAAVLIAVAIGSAAGLIVAGRVSMIQVPALVAFQHGAGGVAAFLISFVELGRITSAGPSVAKIAGLVGAFIGAATFAGSIIASGKLLGRLQPRPTVMAGHNFVLLVTLLSAIVVAGFACATPGAVAPGALALIVLAIVFGWGIAIRVGGADMPVLISFLNASAGLAAAFCGVIIESQLLVAFGATVAASGSILTHMMCRAMNRSLLNVFKGLDPARGAVERPEPATPAAEPDVIPLRGGGAKGDGDPLQAAVSALRDARSVIVVPGYGMALGQAQFEVVGLAGRLAARGAHVRFAVHPVAGRMPGHMNVLLAEAEASYDDLVEMEEINPRFNETDVAIIVGACDVVNPAAATTTGTPISGMPILRAHEARRIIVCNLDDRPGYSGVENDLYARPNVVLLFGDAKSTVAALAGGLEPPPPGAAA